VDKVKVFASCVSSKGSLIEKVNVAGALELASNDRFDIPQTIIQKVPGKAVAADSYPLVFEFKNKIYRYLKVVCSSQKSAMMVIGEVKVYGKAAAAPVKKVIPPHTYRFEAENINGTYKLKKNGLLGNKGAFITRTHQVSIMLPHKVEKSYVYVRYLDNGAKTVECSLNGKPRELPATGGEWMWKYAGEINDACVALQLRRKGRQNGLVDSIIISASREFDPNKDFSIMDLKAIPELTAELSFARQLLKDFPKISPAEFGRRVVEHHGIKYRKPEKTVDGNNNILLNGKPFFPIGFYHVQPDDKRIAEMPVNTFITTDEINSKWGKPGQTAVISHLASLRAYDELVERLKKSDTSRIAMHYLCDEPDGHIGTTVRDIELLNAVVKAACPNNATFLNFAANSTMHKAFVITDAIGLDHYPIPNGRIADIGYTMDAMRYFSKNRPVVFVPQAFSWGGYGQKNGRYPTPDELTAMTFMGLVHGAKGLLFYEFPAPHMSSKTSMKEINPVLWKRLKKIIGCLNSIQDALLGPWVELPGTVKLADSKRRPEFHVIVDEARKNAYLLAVNPWGNKVTTEFQLVLPDAKLSGYFNCGVTRTGNEYTFIPFGTAIFKLESNSLDKLKKLTSSEIVAGLKPVFVRPAGAADVVLPMNGKIDLLDSWNSLKRPDAASISADAKGLHIEATIRFPVGLKSICRKRDGRVWNDPSLELFFGMPNRPDYMHLMVNTINVQADWRFDATKPVPVDKKVDFEWSSTVDAPGEVASFKIFIPWVTLRKMTGAKPGELMTFNMASSCGLLDWVGLTGSGYHAPVRFGRIRLGK
jgi:hypothetical protein